MPPRPPPWKETRSQESSSADYLSSLRSNRPARPTGSRPPPFKSSTYSSPTKEDVSLRAGSALSIRSSKQNLTTLSQIDEPLSSLDSRPSHQRSNSAMPSMSSLNSMSANGRPLVQDPTTNPTHSVRGRKVSPTAVVQASPCPGTVPYRESGTRWIERQEAMSLRDALEAMNQKKIEKRIHQAAQEEAAELVWKHRNPSAAEEQKIAPYRNPELSSRKRFSAHLEKGAHARSQSLAYTELSRDTPKTDSSRSASDSSSHSRGGERELEEPRLEAGSNTMVMTLNAALAEPQTAANAVTSEVQPVIMQAGSRENRRRSSGHRNVSSGSAKGVFRNSEDQIYEEPEEATILAEVPYTELEHSRRPLQSRQRNSLPRGSRPLPDRSSTTPVSKMLDRFEIHRNPLSRSRNGGYTTNTPAPPPAIEVLPEIETPPSKSGIEIRGEDIRAATSMKLKDRSPKLPTPTAVSDRPGRAIVSFDPAWQLTADSPRNSREVTRAPVRPSPSISTMAVSSPAIPTINFPDETSPNVPTINLPGEDQPSIPSINVSNESDIPEISVSGPAPIPTIETPDQQRIRPLPRPAQTSPPKISTTKISSRLPWLNSVPRAGVPTATCANCALPISGRIVTASGSTPTSASPLKAMFHPQCFTCHHCSTALECVAFYPEPENKRRERLEVSGLPVDSPSDLRFFCHLDFHEFFSPRCRSCKTPIEGQVVLAAGAEYHVGHFFCAECGDPFAADTPFVERDGYAYCVGCHTRRTSARCRACRLQILDETTIEALGGKWHEKCFVCLECHGGFDGDGEAEGGGGGGGRFFVREVLVEPTDKEKRRGLLKPKTEERAVCERCEQRRLKA